MKRTRRHPADVTADRLEDAATTWRELFEGRELDDIGFVLHALREIADGTRKRPIYVEDDAAKDRWAERFGGEVIR